MPSRAGRSIENGALIEIHQFERFVIEAAANGPRIEFLFLMLYTRSIGSNSLSDRSLYSICSSIQYALLLDKAGAIRSVN